MAQLNPHKLLPSSSQDALEMYVERYLAVRLLQQPGTWVESFGEVATTGTTSTKYPMAFMALKYLETIDEGGGFRTIGEKDCELTVVQYDVGVEIELLKLLTNTFSAQRWRDAPAGMVQAEAVFRAKTIADALVANTATCGWDDLALFHDSHLCSPKDPNSSTFDNLQATTKDVTDIAKITEEVVLMMDGVLDENGDKLGVMPTHIGVPTAKFHKLTNTLKQDIVANTAGTASIRNPYSDGLLTAVHMPQLTDADDWYLIDANLIAKGAAPWVLAKLQLPAPGFDSLSLRVHDEKSEMYLRHSKIGVSSRIFYGSKFLYPHAIRKVAGA